MDQKRQQSRAVIIADQSAATRRTCRKIMEAAWPADTLICEASTLHAVRVLLRETGADFVIASDDLAGGDADLLVDAIRQSGGDAHIILVARRAHRSISSAVEIVPRAGVADVLPALVGFGAASCSQGQEDPTGGPDQDRDEEILPFRIEERRIIETAIRRTGGNIGKAARALEISPSTIYRKIQLWQAEPRP